MSGPLRALAARFGASAAATRAVLVEPQLRRAVAALAAACTADWASTVALSVVAFRDGGAAAVGLVTLARMLPSAVGAPVLTAIADRVPRERFLAVASAVHALALGGAAICLTVEAAPVVVYVLAVGATVAFTVFRPVHAALLPLLCTTTKELTSANVVSGLVGAVAAFAGPALGGVLLAASDAGAAFFTAAGLSAVAVALLVRIRYPGPTRAPGPRRARRVRREAIEGLTAVARHRDLRLVFGAALAQTFVRGALGVFTVVVAFELLGSGESGVAVLTAALGAGGIVGSFAGSLLVGSRHMGRWLVVALAMWGAPIALLAGTSATPAAFGLVAVVGLANSVFDVPVFTLPVRLVSDAVLARVFGVLESMVALGVAVGSAATPALVGLLGLRGALVAVGLLLPVVGALLWAQMAALDRRLGVRDEEIGVLRAVPMFAALTVPSIEQLAARVSRAVVPAGTVLIRQGEPAESLWVIADGQAEVIGDGAVVRVAEAGESVGEIALLRGVPRTATVRARTDLKVFELDRAAFLDAVGAHGPSRDAADAMAASRLAHFGPTHVDS